MTVSDASSHESPAAGDVHRIAEQFVRARLQATALSSYPGRVPTTLVAAYECQEAAIRRWPDRVGGWKVARIPPEWHSAFPEERLIGPAFNSNIQHVRHAEIVDCPVFAGGLAAVEAELVVCIGADAPAAKLEWTPEEAMELIAGVHIGVEVASSPLATLNELGTGAVISDFGNNWGVIVGPAIRSWRNIVEVTAESAIDGDIVGRGKAVLQTGPIGALVFTLTKCALRGRPLRAGDVISTGMITGVHDIRIGQVSRHSFEGYGEIRCRAVPAVAWKNTPGQSI